MSSSNDWPCVALPAAELAPRTTMRVGGRAEWLLEPATPDELAQAYKAALDRGLKPRVLGGGANLIVEEGTLPGVVITTARLRRLFRPVEGETDDVLAEPDVRVAPEPPESDPRLVAWCGATLPGLVQAAGKLGWSGVEGIVGVPGHVGGGVAMNAGGRWGNLWDVIERVRVLEPDGAVRDLAREECSPAYRDGGLGERIVVGAVMRFEVAGRAAVRERTREYLLEKQRVQPVTEWSAGCIFRNPPPEVSDGRSAGRLVDECGGKGLERGGAVVSERHGNFIVNRGGATAADVFTLIGDVQDLVLERSGVRLETEVKIWRAGDEGRAS